MTDLFGRVSTADTGERSDFDFYPTPQWMTRALLHWHPRIVGRDVFECASGDDAIADVLRASGCDVFTNDIDTRHPAAIHMDATRPELWERIPRRDWVVTNLPFNVAFGVLQHAVPWAYCGVAVLLRKTFLEPTEERGPWLAANPPARQIGMPRHRFRGESTDSVSCDWFIWEKTSWPSQLCPSIVIDPDAKRR